MIAEEVVVSLIRFYDKPIETEYDKYSASCTLLWETPKIVWIKGLSGKLSRQVLRHLALHLMNKGVELVKATRANATLPWATKIDEHYCEIDLTLRGQEIIDKLRA